MARFGPFFRILRAALLEDWLLKFICLGLAVLMWFYIDGELSDSKDVVVTIRKRDVDLPPGWAMVPDRAMPKFTVRVRGPRRRLALLSADDLTFKKQVINNPQPGSNVLDVKPDDLSAEGFEILGVTPKDDSQAMIEVVTTTSRTKPVWVPVIGKPKMGFLMDKPSVDPPQVNVEGPSQALELLESVPTEDVDVAEADKDIIRNVRLKQTVDVNGKVIGIRSSPETVRIIVPIQPEQATRRMTLEVWPVPPAGTAMTVEPKTVEVEVVADAAELAAPDLASKIILYAKWPVTWDKPKDANAILGPAQVPLQVAAPPRVQVRGINGEPLPSVSVRGALASTLNKE